jgi:hypothetical protein
VSTKPAQPHQKRSIVGGESVKYFEFGIADGLVSANTSEQQRAEATLRDDVAEADLYFR